jgi:hypothetical protein
MSDDKPPMDDAHLAAALERLEQRLTRLERFLDLPPFEAAPAPEVAPVAALEPAGEELEVVVGQNWFAAVGIVVLTCGVGFALSLPFAQLPAAVPSLIGWLLTGGLFFAAHLWRNSFALASHCLRGAAMALLYFSTLRLFFFGATPVLDMASGAGRVVLLLAVALNLTVALRQTSGALVVLALLTGYVTAAVVGSPWWLFAVLAVLSLLIVDAARRRGAMALLLFAVACGYLTYLFWMIGAPWAGRAPHLALAPESGVFFLLLHAVILGVGPLLRRERPAEDHLTILVAVGNCAAGYGLFFAHSILAFPPGVAPAHLFASLVFLGLAVIFWLRAESRGATFFYAMTGYLALTVAILKAFALPNLFIWLSLQSLLVVATALWFRSRFIVVANFFIFVTVVLGYMFTAGSETGISLGFGIVALLTARILNWQRERLELRTDLMRNAYLACAFVVFPYALYHLVPRAYVSVSWVGVAVVYYALNLIVRNVKYRWMGHLTLLLTVLYVVVIGVAQLAPAYRIATLLLLGTVLLVVSLAFTKVRSRWRAEARKAEGR